MVGRDVGRGKGPKLNCFGTSHVEHWCGPFSLNCDTRHSTRSEPRMMRWYLGRELASQGVPDKVGSTVRLSWPFKKITQVNNFRNDILFFVSSACQHHSNKDIEVAIFSPVILCFSNVIAALTKIIRPSRLVPASSDTYSYGIVSPDNFSYWDHGSGAPST